MIDDPSSLVATSEDGGGEGEWAIEILHNIDTLVVEVDGEYAVVPTIEQIGTILDVHLPRGGVRDQTKISHQPLFPSRSMLPNLSIYHPPQ